MSVTDSIARALAEAKRFAAGMIRRSELSTSPASFFAQLAGYADESFNVTWAAGVPMLSLKARVG